MAAGSTVRLVRCPKCENLLPELPNYSVYQCGGCGAFLRAKKKAAINGLLEKREKKRDEEAREGFEKLQSLSEKEDGSNLGIASEAELESDMVFLDRRNVSVFRERTAELVISSSLNIENKETSIDSSNGTVKEQILGYERGAERGNGSTNNYRLPLKHPIGNRAGRGDNEMNMNKAEFVNSSREKGVVEISAQVKGSAGSLRSRMIAGNWSLDKDGMEGPYANPRMAADQSSFATFASSDEGPSNYCLSSSSYGYGKMVKNFDDLDGSNRFARLEQNRAELLRKLDELKEHICRNGSAAEKQSEGAFGAYHDSATYNVPVKPLAPDKHVQRNPYFKQHGRDIDMQNFYFPPNHVANEFPVYEDPIQLKLPRMSSHQPPGQYWQQTPADYVLEEYRDFNQEQRIASYPCGTPYQDPPCACFHCYNNNRHVSSRVPVSVFGNKNILKDPTDSHFNYRVNPITFGSKKCKPQANPPKFHAQDPQSHGSWPSDLDSDVNVFHQRRPRRVVVARGNVRLCHPIAGGAPFITCSSCFMLLKLPRKLKAREKNQQKLQCGACLTVFLFEIKNKQLIISIPTEMKQILAGANEGSSEVSKEVPSIPHGGFIAQGMDCSVNVDNPGHDFQTSDFKRNILSEVQRLKLIEFEKRQHLSLSPISSGEEEDLDSVIVKRVVSYIPELPTKDNASPKFPGLPLSESLDDVSSNKEENRHGKGNKSNGSDHEKVILDKSTSQQKSVKDASETEVEVSFTEYLSTNLSQDSMEMSEEKDQSRINKGSESFLVGLLRKGFGDFSRSKHHVEGETEESNISVNGQPIPDSMVKRAEKLAGPILPGDYWYDFEAGFWGVMGQPCLGIIPPFIKEFNYPMPENCGAGNTSVFVNGRELHQKDLDLLASRGLPTTSYKFYTVGISGRVLEKDSAKELNSLGELAPTVQKLKRGFGMKVPRRKPV
ncbi:hypothetical protein P3X46_030141 [Hevea brasiliensis]|uniref:Zinc-ribbon domain-containing protein n=1 Tax=Hevea brasiliensis TaxID=3981 RepID=A0ABQ9KUG3_HEVBR|nr:protein ENHANCED DISEASE RESISTANCE 4 [Hevea brasiliensis]KAJ9148045.1 hypothetical protein P3X46_030141 [Hevea brasiliensis]